MANWLFANKRKVNIIYWIMIVILFLSLMLPNAGGLSVWEWILSSVIYALIFYFIKKIVFWFILKKSSIRDIISNAGNPSDNDDKDKN